jgi:hypothetical protein
MNVQFLVPLILLIYDRINLKEYKHNNFTYNSNIAQVKNLYSFDKYAYNCNGNLWNMNNNLLCEENRKVTGILNRHILAIPFKSEYQNITFEIKSQNDEMWYENPNLCRIDTIKSFNCKKHNIFKKDCIFMHGAGQNKIMPPTKDFKEYWGNVINYTQHCKSHIFIRQDTKNRGWDNHELQKAYCIEKIYNNKILYVHSMGNLILAAAIKNNFCKIGNNVTWYHIGGPFKGSKAANLLYNICTHPNTNKYYKYIARKGGYCMPNKDDTYPVYKTLVTNYTGLKDLYPIAKKYVTGSMCGTSPVGLYSKYSLLLKILSYLTDYKELNDGMVGIDSCMLNDNYTKDYKSNYYDSSTNHADITCLNGDGYWDYPCSYYMDKS